MRTDWILDVVLGIFAIVLFGVMMLFLPTLLPAAYGYVAAFLIFLLFLTIAGLTVVLRRVGRNPAKKNAKKTE